MWGGDEIEQGSRSGGGFSRPPTLPGGMDPHPCPTSHQVRNPAGEPDTWIQPQTPSFPGAPNPFRRLSPHPSVEPHGTEVSHTRRPSQVWGSKGTSTGPVAGRRQSQKYFLWPELPFPPELHLLAGGRSPDPRPLPGGDPCLGLTRSLRMFVSSEVTIGQEVTPRHLTPLPACFSPSRRDRSCKPCGSGMQCGHMGHHPGALGSHSCLGTKELGAEW